MATQLRGAEARVAGAGSVRAWDLPTRLFKWGLVFLVLLSWLTQWRGDDGIVWHIRAGYGILILLVFRLFWGMFGSSTSRFSAWVSWPLTALGYGLAALRGRGRPYLGHNPTGAWMILALLLFVGAQAVSGLFTVDNNGLNGGPFANLDFGDPTPVQAVLSRWHHWSFYYVLLGLIVVHVAVNLTYQFLKRDPVVAAMITGRKPVEPFADEAEMRPAPALWTRAALCLAAAAAVVLGGVKLFGGSLP